eukprot:TRINITY_DN4869_c0_g1_i1.p1 TRINITY_DN4869_c0_g1~~TRINITY_DN4869_c0_g1_i1.p1  ORF type:complete len:561 (+),score=86.00 TRINITY_DN4869_c0_g1_i1:264-1946(+)
MGELENVAYPVAVAVVLLFGAAACVYAVLRQRKQGHADTPEFFLTARGSVSLFTVAWSFYAGAMGSWALFSPPSYCLYAGVMGTVFYALSSGFPVIIVAYFGSIIQDLVPNVMSVADFVNRRFGRPLALYVGLLTLFNMGVALTAEYTAVGDLFQYVIGAVRWPIVVIIGVVAMLYTAAGGLYVSIITDQWQAMLSIVTIVTIFIYVAVTFKGDLSQPLPNNYLDLGFVDLTSNNYYGWAAIAVMPLSLTTSSFFSEAVWQRCWAAADRRTLLLGSTLGALMVTIVVMLLGFGGIIAVWGGVWVPAGPDDTGNTILFSLLGNTTWIIVVVAVLSVTLSESAIDSLQNAIVDTVSICFITPLLTAFSPASSPPLKISLWWIRGLVVVLNIPPIYVSLKGYNIIQLFLLANLITSTSTIPVFLGVIPGRKIQKIITPFSSFSGCGIGMASLFVWAKTQQVDGQSYSSALHDTFLINYDWPPFMLAIGFSIVGIVVGAVLEMLFRLAVPACREYPYFDLRAPNDTDALIDGEERREAIEGGDGEYTAGHERGVDEDENLKGKY